MHVDRQLTTLRHLCSCAHASTLSLMAELTRNISTLWRMLRNRPPTMAARCTTCVGCSAANSALVAAASARSASFDDTNTHLAPTASITSRASSPAAASPSPSSAPSAARMPRPTRPLPPVTITTSPLRTDASVSASVAAAAAAAAPPPPPSSSDAARFISTSDVDNSTHTNRAKVAQHGVTNGGADDRCSARRRGARCIQ
mmetsp:Transcript_46125/g.113166  ORF Transcript_46125/g.113166 Transcript_46125/m.113166 type:complete len:201 (+) Transcript_46125:702-1304(+)